MDFPLRAAANEVGDPRLLASNAAATTDAAAFLGRSYGVKPGSEATLVVLEGSPIEDIRNTRRINAVVVNGRYLPKEALQRMLDDIEAAARK